MAKHELELSIGATVQVGRHVITVVDIDGPEVVLRIETIDPEGVVIDCSEWSGEVAGLRLPR